MNHLDEGTIHAWLDGALDERQAADVQAHVDQCTACAALVAEARGLIAASSRILTALDDVPAGVTPQRAAPPKVRRWASSSGWITGIAAALVVIALWRTTGVEKGQPMTAVDLRALDSIAVTTIPAVAETPVPPPQSAPLPAVVQPATTGAANQSQPQGPAAVARADGRAAFGGVGSGGRGDAAQGTRAAVGAVAAAEMARDTTRVMRLSEELQRAEAPVKAAEGKDAAGTRASWSGCYSLTLAMAKVPTEVVAATANVTTDNRARRVASGAPAAAAARTAQPAPTAQKSSFAASDALSLIRLDTIARQAGFAVRAAVRSDSAIGIWREITPDSVRVELPTRGRFTVARRDRVACPQ